MIINGVSQSAFSSSTTMDQLVFDRCGKAVVRLHFHGRFQGSGFAIHAKDDECLVMTCAHVVRSLGDINGIVDAYFAGENEAFGCKLLHGDETADLALLQSIPGARSFTAVAPLEFLVEPVTFRKDVVLLAYYTLDDSVTPMIQPGTSLGRIISPPTPESTDSIVCNSSCKRGTSGGPVICNSAQSKLQVAGVHSQTNMGNSYARPVTVVRKFLLDWVTAWKDIENPNVELSMKTMLEMGARLHEQVESDDEVEEAETLV